MYVTFENNPVTVSSHGAGGQEGSWLCCYQSTVALAETSSVPLLFRGGR